MIELLTGENDFELTKAIAQIRADFDGTVERFEASELAAEQLADIFAGQTLFALTRCILIDTPSANAELWQNLPKWSERLSGDTRLLLIEPKPDKRTSSYKWLKANATVRQFDMFDERDAGRATAWVHGYAKQVGTALTDQQARRLVHRAGTNQWTLAHAVDKLSLLDVITDEWIDDIVEPRATESVFALFETALNSDVDHLSNILAQLRRTEEPYRIFGLIISQALQLTALIYGEGNVERVATDTGAKSSYPLQKLSPYAARLTKRHAAGVVKIIAEGDTRLKSSDADPWIVLESTLVQIASLVKV